MDKAIFPSHTNGEFSFIDDLLNVVNTDLTRTSVSQSIQITNNYLDRFKTPSNEYIAWDLLRSDPHCIGTVVNTLVLSNGNIAGYSWDDKTLKTYSYSYAKKEYAPGISGEEPVHHNRNEWIVGISHYAEKYGVKPGLRKVVSKIISFSDLNENWDTYNAKPIQSITIARAANLFTIILNGMELRGKSIPVPFVAPCSNGGIQFEWEMSNKELTIVVPPEVSKPLEYLWVYSDITVEEQVVEGTFDYDQQTIEAVNCLLLANPFCSIV